MLRLVGDEARYSSRLLPRMTGTRFHAPDLKRSGSGCFGRTMPSRMGRGVRYIPAVPALNAPSSCAGDSERRNAATSVAGMRCSELSATSTSASHPAATQRRAAISRELVRKLSNGELFSSVASRAPNVSTTGDCAIAR